MQPKIPLPDDADLSPEVAERLGALPPLNVFRMAANAQANFIPFIDFASSILFATELDPREREIAILRVAKATGSNYEWTQHLVLARNEGVTESEIEIIDADGPVTALDDTGNLLCRVADEISRDVRLSDEALAAIMAHYGTRRSTELIFCCSYFNMLSRFLESTRVELEQDYVLGGG